jgi:poly(A) polymerase
MSERVTAEWLKRPQTQAVFAAFAQRGIVVRAVGGAVRNALLGEPASDVDLATPAMPEETMAAAQAAGFGVIPTGLQHGTVTIMGGGVAYEVTTLRRDVATDGRHAVVSFTDDWAVDAARRDFTINALYCEADGTLHDPLGSGLDDLAARRVRFIGDAEARIREDYLRILRFFRFTAVYAMGEPDADGLAASSRLRDGLAQLSAERIRVELLKLLVAPRAADVVAVMAHHGYWPALLGAVPWPSHLERLIAADNAVDKPRDAIQRLAALAVMTGDDACRVSARLRLSRVDGDRLAAVARLVPLLSPAIADYELRVLLYRHGRDDVMTALGVAAARHGGDWHKSSQRGGALDVPVLPVRGQDLLSIGLLPGPEVGTALRWLEARWIDRDFRLSRDDLLALHRDRAGA